MNVASAEGPPLRRRRLATPYVGLVPYTEEDAEFFFGRDEARRIVAGNLRASRLTLLYGSSGVGKTSLLRAGVVHDLRLQTRADRAGRHRTPFAVCVFAAWHDNPLAELMASIHAAAIKSLGSDELPPWQPGEPIVMTLRTWAEKVRALLVVLDQFEDYFLYHPDEDGAGTVAGELPSVVNDPSLPVNILIAIREDGWAKLDRFEGRIPQLFRNYIRVEHLDRASAREAIERPIAEWNRRLLQHEQPYRLEPQLVDAVLDAAAGGGLAPVPAGVRGEPDVAPQSSIEAPFLQLVMERLWRATVASGSHELTCATLERLGGAERIVENHLRDALATLNTKEQALAADVFRFLVTRSKTKIAHSSSDLAEWTGRSEPDVSAVLEKLCREEGGRILRRVPPPAASRESMRYELFHDVLAEPILDWRRGYEQERARRAAMRRLLRVGGLLLSLVAVFAALGIWALIQRSDARHASRSATSLALASDSSAQLGGHAERALLLGFAAYRTSPTPEATSAVVSALGKLTGLAAILRGGTDAERAIAFSRNGRLLAAADAEGTLRLWDVPARTPAGKPLLEDAGEVWSLAFSPDGRMLAAAGADGTVRLWNLRTRTQARITVGQDSGAIRSVAFSPDGRLLAAAGEDGAVWLGDAHDVKRRVELRGREQVGGIVTIAFSPDGRVLAVAGEDGSVHLWNVGTRAPLATLPSRGSSVLCVVFSPDGRTLAASSDNGIVRLWNVRSRAPLRELTAEQTGPVWSVSFSPDGRTLAGAGYHDDTIRLWNARSGRLLRTLPGHAGAVVSVAFSPDGRLLASAGHDSTVRLWTIVSDQPPRDQLRGLRGAAHTVAFSPDGRTLVAGGYEDGRLLSWDVASGRRVGEFPTRVTDAIESVAFSPDGDTLASGGHDDLVHLWDTKKRRALGSPLRAGASAVLTVAFSPDGRTLAAAGHDGRIRLWRLDERGSPLVLRGHAGDVSSIAFSPDGRTLASAGVDGTVRLWDVQGRKPLGRLPLGERDSPANVAFSPDGHVLALGERRGWLRLWDLRRHAWLGAPLKGHLGGVEGVAFSPADPRMLASAGDDGTVQLWDVREHKRIGRFENPGGAGLAIAFSPDGRTFASASADGTVRIWRMVLWHNLPDLERRVCRLVVGDLQSAEWADVAPGLAYRTTCDG